MDAIQYREYPIPANLAPFVKCIWSLEGNQPSYKAPRERILPDGCVELVFHSRDPFWTHFAIGKSSVQPQSFVVGQMNRFMEIEPRGRIGFVAIRFHAYGAYRFLPGSLKAVAAGVVDASNVWKKTHREWSDSIASAKTMSSRVAVVESLLWRALRSGRGQDMIVDRCLHLIEMHCGERRIAHLAAEIGASTRELSRRFENAVGISPKEFSRVCRFRHALHRLRAKRHESLTETAVACGYYDQAHFNHEFRELAGIAPGEFFTRPNLAF
jgi:AraC-like DNA-binding protein